jgi:hypothetical protein
MKFTLLGHLVHSPTVHEISPSSRASHYGAFSNRWIVVAEDGNGGFIIL